MNNGWIGVDLDGTLATFNKWLGFEHIGEPILPMVQQVRRWHEEGQEVRIFTARASLPDPNPLTLEEMQAVSEQVYPITKWCIDHLGFQLPITNRKDFMMMELWDDRCVQVIPNEGTPTVHFYTSEYTKVQKALEDAQVEIKQLRQRLSDAGYVNEQLRAENAQLRSMTDRW